MRKRQNVGVAVLCLELLVGHHELLMLRRVGALRQVMELDFV